LTDHQHTLVWQILQEITTFLGLILFYANGLPERQKRKNRNKKKSSGNTGSNIVHNDTYTTLKTPFNNVNGKWFENIEKAKCYKCRTIRLP
jgi:hypothetical protein